MSKHANAAREVSAFTLPSSAADAPVCSQLSTPTGTIYAPRPGRVGGRVPGHIKIDGRTVVEWKLRAWEESELPRNRVKPSLCFLPLDARVLYPEARIVALACVGHRCHIEKLKPDVEGTHCAVIAEVAG